MSFKALSVDSSKKINRLEKLEDAQALLEQLGTTASVYELQTERKVIFAPPLHSLLKLQKEANKFYGVTSAQTLKIAQGLYEKSLLHILKHYL